jgi:hypothetical protein
MRSLVSLTAIFMATTLLLVAQKNPPPDESKDAVAPVCSVSGRVVTVADGTPLKSAHVVLMMKDAGRDRKLYGATTDSNGNFDLKNVVPGRYKFMASRTGYVTREYQSQEEGSGATLALTPKQQVSGVLFRLTPAAVVQGRITDEVNEPLADIQVFALRKPNDEDEDDEPYYIKPGDLLPAGQARTDDRGAYRIFGLKPGEYYIKAIESLEPDQNVSSLDDYLRIQAVGREFAAVYFPGVMQRSQAEAVLLRPAEETQIDITLRHVKTVEISGRVVGPNGKAANASVDLQEERSQEYSGNISSRADAEGKFKLTGVPPGNYSLVVYQEASDNVYRPSARQKLEVGNEDLDSIVITLGQGGNFTGKVTMDGPSTARPDHLYVSLESISGEDWGHGSNVKQDGTFEIKGVEEGDYAVAVHGREAGLYLKSARLGADDVLANGLQVEKGSGGTLNVVMSMSGAQLEGSVVQDDKPVVGARIHIAAEPETPYNRSRRKNTTTDQDGHFVIVGVAPGKYRITGQGASDPGKDPIKAEPQSVTLSEREHKTLQLKLIAPPPQ